MRHAKKGPVTSATIRQNILRQLGIIANRNHDSGERRKALSKLGPLQDHLLRALKQESLKATR